MLVWDFRKFDEVASTQAVASKLAEEGAPEGTVVVAQSQHSGKGRLGRTWHSPRGGLYMSLILRPESLRNPQELSLVASVSVVDGIGRSTGLTSRIRWPNDVMVGNRKLAGVIVEAQSKGADLNFAVVGIGINCNSTLQNDEGLDATSLSEELGSTVNIAQVRNSVLDLFSTNYQGWRAGNSLLPRWRGLVGTLGRDISIRLKTEENEFSCRALDIRDDWSLVVQVDGKQRVVDPESLERLVELG